MHQIYPPDMCFPQNLESRINTGHTVVACTSPYAIVDFVYQQTKISA